MTSQCLLPVLLGWLLSFAPTVHAATNVALGGIGGLDNGTLVDGGGTGDARFTLESVRLALVKQARSTDGVVLASDAPVLSGQDLVFVLYVDNATDFPVSGITLTDQLDESAFTYVAGTLESAEVPSGADDATLWSAAWVPLSDAPGAPDDAGSATDTGGPAGPDRITVGAEPAQANLPVTIPARTLRAVRFRVQVN